MSKSHRKGIILAGGAGTRLHPITLSLSKQLLPVYDKPMIYYPARHFDVGGDPRIPDHRHAAGPDRVPRSFGRGEQWGVSFEYAVQAKPNGIAQAFIIAEDFSTERPRR